MNKIQTRVHALTSIESDGRITQTREKRTGEKSAYLAICSNSEYENHAICTFVWKMRASCRHQSLLSSDITFSVSWLRRILSAGYDALKPDINLQAFLRNVLPPSRSFNIILHLYAGLRSDFIPSGIPAASLYLVLPTRLPLQWTAHVSYITSSPQKLVNQYKL